MSNGPDLRGPVPNFETHLGFHTPLPAWVNDKEWSWSFRKFGYKHGGALFTELHEEFNSFKCAIQDPQGWHLDVSEIADRANNREQFFSLLTERRKERFAEIQRAWEKTSAQLVAEPDRWETLPDRLDTWYNFILISRNFSYDSLLRFFGEYIKDPKSRPGAHPSEPPNLERKRLQQQPPSQTPPEKPNAGDVGPDQSPRRLRERGQPSRLRATRTRISKVSASATETPNKTRRKSRRYDTEASTQGGLRRSARLRERAERGSR
ncbi:hypothetical protein F5Y10DRAFT_259249 [Nemania abortiva]|nr:hypothetical protein F5Y10DRAFT_259249 [Nemania abortiva]